MWTSNRNLRWRCMPSFWQRSAEAEKARQILLAESVIRISGGVKSLVLTGELLGDDGTKRLADALLENETLRCFCLDNNEIGDAGAGYLADVLAAKTGLHVLDLDFNDIADDGVSALASALRTNASLQELDLHFNLIGSSGAKTLAEALEVNSTLQSISLHGNTIGDLGASHFAQALQKNATLKFLHLGDAAIGDQGALKLAEALETNRVLWALHLEENHIGDEGAISLAKAVLSNHALGELWLLKNAIAERGAHELSRCLQKPGTLKRLGLTFTGNSRRDELLGTFKKRHALQHAARNLMTGAACLDLNGLKLGDDGVKELVESITFNSHLKELHLKENCISDIGVQHLAHALQTCAQMEKVSLARNVIGDAGASRLALFLDMPRAKNIRPADTDGIELPKVRELDLGDNLIGDIGAISLAEVIENNAPLEKLSLQGNSNIGDAAMSRLNVARESSETLRELTLDEALSVPHDVESGTGSSSRETLNVALASMSERCPGSALLPDAPCGTEPGIMSIPASADVFKVPMATVYSLDSPVSQFPSPLARVPISHGKAPAPSLPDDTFDTESNITLVHPSGGVAQAPLSKDPVPLDAPRSRPICHDLSPLPRAPSPPPSLSNVPDDARRCAVSKPPSREATDSVPHDASRSGPVSGALSQPPSGPVFHSRDPSPSPSSSSSDVPNFTVPDFDIISDVGSISLPPLGSSDKVNSYPFEDELPSENGVEHPNFSQSFKILL